MEFPISLKQFQEWAKALPEDRRFDGCSPLSCPISVAVREISGAKIAMGVTRFSLLDDDSVFGECPDWRVSDTGECPAWAAVLSVLFTRGSYSVGPWPQGVVKGDILRELECVL